MGYFYDKYQEMKAKREEKKELQAAAEQYVEDFKNTVHYYHYKMKMEGMKKDHSEATERLLSKDPEPESLGGFFTTAEKISEPEGDPRYKTPKKEPAVPRELAESVIEETEIYKRAKESILNAQLRQVSYGIEKYPEPLKADTWTILETIRHIKEESIDTLHYLTMLEIKFEELAKQELPSTEESLATLRELTERLDKMKEVLDEESANKIRHESEREMAKSNRFYHSDKPYDMNYDNIYICPAEECCGNLKGCEAAGTKLDSFGTDIKNKQEGSGELRLPSKYEPPKTPNQVRKSMGLPTIECGIDFAKAMDTEWTATGINLKNTDIINYSPIDFEKASEDSGMFFKKYEKELVDAGILREEPIVFKTGVKYAELPGVVQVSGNDGQPPISVLVQSEEDVRFVEMAVEEQIARAQLRRNQ